MLFRMLTELPQEADMRNIALSVFDMTDEEFEELKKTEWAKVDKPKEKEDPKQQKA